MSTAAISTPLITQETPLQSYLAQRTSDLQQLRQDLQSGNLAAAQTDFSNIQTLAQSSPFANGNAFAVNARQQEFNAIGQALQAGDLAGAQQAFSQLRNSFHPRHVDPQGGPDTTVTINFTGTPASPVTLNTTPISNNGPVSTSPTATSTPETSTTGFGNASAASGPEIVLNLGNAPAGEQITIGVGNGPGGAEQVSLSVSNPQNQSPELFTFNLNQNSNAQIVLNLLNSTTPSSGQVGSNVSVSA